MRETMLTQKLMQRSTRLDSDSLSEIIPEDARKTVEKRRVENCNKRRVLVVARARPEAG